MKPWSMRGVVRIFTAKDIPGENQIGGIVPDEELLASDSCSFLRNAGCIGSCRNRRSGKSSSKKNKS